jgi:hypothetical protein
VIEMGITKKDLTFEFFKNNPQVLYSECKPEYLEQLGIKEGTYKKHKDEYTSIFELNKAARDPIYIREPIVRQKFLFNDSKLFEKGSD